MVDRLLKVAKDMYKGSRAVKKAGFHRPEGAGNFDNMDDYVMSDLPIDPKVQTAIDAAGDNIPASNITPGTFGGSANYAFPTTLTINGSIINLTPTFGVSTIRSNNSDARMDYATNRTTSTQTAHRFIVNGTDIAMDIVDNKKIEMFDDLTVSGDIIVNGTVDGVDIAARDHAESHTIASHSDTTGTGAELNTLTDGSETTLHSHAGGGGDVTSASNITDNAIVRGDGGAKGVQRSRILIDDSDNITGVTTLEIDGTVGGLPPDPNVIYRENICKGWINFNSSGTIAIRDSFNVSGITDHGTGDYTVTWDTDFADANYGVWVTRRQHSLGSNLASTGIHSSVNPVVSSVRILQESSDANGNSVRTEGDIMMVIAFGAQ